MNHFDTMRQAIAEAKQIQQAADTNAEQLALVLQGRLRRVNCGPHWYRGVETLRSLKRELRDFNAVTGRWKS